MTVFFDDDQAVMGRALELARRGLGFAEPNPLVGAVLVDDQRRLLGEGFHERFGAAHAEVNALAQAGGAARRATLFVTLEPCCHQGKTPPCTRAIRQAGIRRVVVATGDPNPQVAGQGIEELRAAGISVEVGLRAAEARELIAPFATLKCQGRPWVIAKWAMTLDGRIAARSGDSQWISSSQSRELVHRLRGRVDAIVVGIGTAIADDPLLTARPPGPRLAKRIVVDTTGRLSESSQLVQTASEVPTLVATTQAAPEAWLRRMQAARVETLILPQADKGVDLTALLKELGRRDITNLLVEGGGGLLGSLFDLQKIDEVRAFIAPKLVGGRDARSPLLGQGLARIAEAAELTDPVVQHIDGDFFVEGRVRW